MYISKRPFRISLFGGGTDYPEYFQKYGSQCIGGSINKYNSLNLQTDHFEKENYILSFKETKKYLKINKIWHPVVKKFFEKHKVKRAKITYSADLIGRSGIGSSSSFTIGMIDLFNEIKNKNTPIKKLILEAYKFERHTLNNFIGIQDHIFCAQENFGIINFKKKAKEISFSFEKIDSNDERINYLNSNLILFSTNIKRISSNIEKDKILNLDRNIEYLHQIKNLTKIAINVFKTGTMDHFLNLLNDYWYLKKNLSTKVTNPKIDEIIKEAREAGAISQKVVGSGGGGFILFYCKKKNQTKLIKKLRKLKYFKIKYGK